MSLSCSCDNDDAEWWYVPEDDFAPLSTKRFRLCCSCGAKILPGIDALRFKRTRYSRNEIEERIYGDDFDAVSLAPWFMCETCGGLFMAITELGFCHELGKNIAKQIREYREMELAANKRQSRALKGGR